MKNSTKGKIIRYSSVVALDAGAPLAATCAYFPMWVNKGSEATVCRSCAAFAYSDSACF